MAIATTSKPPRAYPSVNAIHCIRAQVQQVNPNPALGQRALKNAVAVPIGTIPAGSFVLAPSKHTIVAVDGTAIAIIVGHATDDDAFVVTGGALQTLGFAGNLTGGAGLGYVAEDTVVLLKASWTGTSNTQGNFDLVIPFYPARD